ncbi:hypothetical protein [Methanocaldococcus sp.]
MSKECLKKDDINLFVSALYYSINKSIGDVMGSGGMVLGRRASKEMIDFLKDEGILKENMSFEDIKELFVDKFGLSEDLKIEDSGKEVVFYIVKPTLTKFLQKIKEQNLKPFVCPFIHLLSYLYEELNNHKFRLMLTDVQQEHDTVKLIFKKVYE